MLVKTKFFGEVDLPEEKILTFERGLIGLADYKRFTILYDCEKEETNISWLQSVDEPTLALPVIKPWLVKEEYNPTVEDVFPGGTDRRESGDSFDNDGSGRYQRNDSESQSAGDNKCRYKESGTDHCR